MDRLVVEYEATSDDELRPVPRAEWRIEPARAERDLHRRLAELADAGPAAIARAASTYGPLRLGAEIAQAAPPGAWDEVGTILGQAALPDWSAAVDWLDRGCQGSMPAVVVGALPLLRAMAADTSDAYRRFTDSWFAGADPEERRALGAEIEAGGGIDPAARQSALVGGIMQLTNPAATSRPTSVSPCDDEALAWAIRLFARLQSLLAGQDTPPPGLDLHGLVFTWVSNMADALTPLEQDKGTPPDVMRLVRELRTEKLEAWHRAAAELGDWVAAIELRKRADLGALAPDDVLVLRRLLASLLGNVREGTQGASTAGELEALLRPRFRLRLERRLQEGGAWPYPADRPVGAYWRALWATWEEFTDARPPQKCEKCGATFPAHGNRRFCDACRREHDRLRKRRGASQALGG